MSEETAGKTADQSVDLQHMPELVIVTGMSGAGRTEAMHSFEDLGYFCVDKQRIAVREGMSEVQTEIGRAHV